MKFKLGEFVRFIDENREGYITRIIDDQVVAVTGDDDFEIPVAVSNLARVHGHMANAVEADFGTGLEEEELSAAEFSTKGISIAFVQDLNKGSLVHFYLVNETSFELLVTLTTVRKDDYKGEFAAKLGPLSITKMHTASLPELDLWPKFLVDVLTFTSSNIKPLKPINLEYRFKAKDFSDNKKTIPFIKQQGWILQLDEPEVKIDVQKLKESFYNQPKSEENKVDKPQREIDLHIEKLRDDHQFLSKSEILNIQLAEFHSKLAAAIVHKFPDIVFIHGVGNGVLRDNIHKALGKHSQVRTFKDAQREKFGYGATEVIFKI
ncbi:Smr protein/MutS2 [Pseudopedobacter saltans DSM 12145]|uniref:Smr protein/MutS2 n=1 Tax=Pseudopedobacter saltans (strain ATCC 51119 / DSM 12145 / JCM 21818 / CCUG 39354 / LMG 10337 / NBRC 100064 / NCIMB 13643) TaxID=762903 RepID=F0S815_PSESL|nr:Smr/MutS family protein [Pseudopedobacter saltans]ADY51236.1 Smr protein/MutS2 [Pseudopedobacter saltans DSM 12145]